MVSSRATVLSVLLGLVSPALASGPTDIATYVTARHKTKDPAARAALTLDFALAVARESKANLDSSKFKGLKEWLNEAASDVKELRTAKGAEDPQVVALIARLKDAGAEVQAAVDYIKANQLGAVPMPDDVYSGSDKGRIKAAITDAWKERYPADKVLAVRLPKKEWERKRSEERVGSEWKQYDISSMVVKVIVDKDEERVTIHTVYVQVNHHKSEELEVGRKGAGFDPQDMARKNFKP